MSASGLMNAVVEFVADRLVNDAGRPVPSRVLRYHGVLPHDCCTEDGFLAVHWLDGRASSDGSLTSNATSRNDPCASRSTVTLVVRYVICWPEPKLVEGLPQIDAAYDAEVNEKAGMLADVEDVVVREFIRATCSRPDLRSPLVDAATAAIWRNVAGTSLRFLDASPILPLGKCAGVQWRLNAAPLPGPVS